MNRSEFVTWLDSLGNTRREITWHDYIRWSYFDKYGVLLYPSGHADIWSEPDSDDRKKLQRFVNLAEAKRYIETL